MHGFQVFEKVENGQYIRSDELDILSDYISGHLIGDYTPNYRYWYNMSAYYGYAFIVCRWKEKNGLLPITKWGEAICKDKLVDIFKEHKNCKTGCGSVYFK